MSNPGFHRRPSAGGRWILPVLMVLFIAVPIAEIWLLIQTGQVIGALPTIGLVIAIAVLGSWMAKREGSRAWNALNGAMRSGRMPQGELADAALVLVGAVLLIFPGFFTDIIGLVFLLPFTRPLCRRLLNAVVASRVKKMGMDPRLLGTPGRPDPLWRDTDTIPGETVPDPEPRQHDSRRNEAGQHHSARDDRIVRGEVEP